MIVPHTRSGITRQQMTIDAMMTDVTTTGDMMTGEITGAIGEPRLVDVVLD